MSIPRRASMLWQNIQANGFGMYAVTIWERIAIIFWLRIETYPICFLFISVFPLGQMRFLISFCVASFCRFRKLFVSFSSYTYVNTLRKIEEVKQSWRNILKRISLGDVIFWLVSMLICVFSEWCIIHWISIHFLSQLLPFISAEFFTWFISPHQYILEIATDW
jgi:hypothetical protein